jgi:spore coat polysaccharide biosynthesis protein SpsF
MTRIVAIVQARMGSTRLPGKVLLPAAGKPLIVHMLERVRRCRTLSETWLATSTSASDDTLEHAVSALGVPVHRGSENDVLSRFVEVVARSQADLIVRLTGDCPLHDPAIIDAVVGFALENANRFDYAGNALEPTYPDGLDVEVFTRAALEAADREARTPLHREHVTPLIHRHHDSPRSSRVGHFRGPADFSHLRWTVDEPRDYNFVRRVFDSLYPGKPEFGWLDVIALLTRQPELLAENAGIARNEGYFKALREQSSHG